MNKKLLPALVGAALAGSVNPAAADVSVMGHIDVSYIGFDQDGGSDDTVFSCTTCSVGFKGSEDLGNGLKAIFKIDFQYDAVNRNSSGSITDRDQWVGLGGGFGKVRIGTISTVYKSHGAMIDPLYRTALQGRDRGLQSGYHSSAGEELQGRADNTFRYDSPDFNGFKVGAHYTLDSDETDGEDDNPYGIGASYSNGGILAFADYMTNDGSTASPFGERDAWKVGGKYSGDIFGVMGQYEDYQNSSTDEETAWHVAGTVSLLGIDMYLGFGKTEDDTSSHDLTSWTLAVSHNLSKRTMVYAGHSQIDCDAGANATLSACSNVGAGGGEDDKTALGIKHKF
ncbi:MAG: porin [Halobacteria archaeon]|nr:porin [Halobacteria archaeon]